MGGNLSPPLDLYLVLVLGVLLFGFTIVMLLGDVGVLSSAYAEPFGPTSLIVALDCVFLGGATYLAWRRSKKGENPFRSRRPG